MLVGGIRSVCKYLSIVIETTYHAETGPENGVTDAYNSTHNDRLPRRQAANSQPMGDSQKLPTTESGAYVV